MGVGEANTEEGKGWEDGKSEKAEINRRKRWILRESHGRVKKSGFESPNSPVNPSRRDVESFSLSSRSVRGSRGYLTQLQPSVRNRKRGLVTVPGSCVEFKIPADAEKKREGVITTNRAYLKNETRGQRKLSHAPNWLLFSKATFRSLIRC